MGTPPSRMLLVAFVRVSWRRSREQCEPYPRIGFATPRVQNTLPDPDPEESPFNPDGAY